MAGTVTNGRTQSSSSAAVGSMNSSSLPSLFRGQSSNRRVSASMLVSTECQTDSSLVVVQQQVREENARNDHMDPSTSARPLSQQSDCNGVPEMQDASTAAPRRRRREKRRHRRSHQQVVSSQPLQQHVQQVLHDQTMLVVDSTTSPSSTAVAAPVSPSNSDHLPDILNAHMPPPYSTLPHNSERCMGMGPIPITALSVPLSVPVMALSPPPPSATTTILPPLHSSTPVAAAVASSTTVAGPLLSSSSFSLPPAGGRRSRASMYAGDVEGGKSCCGVTVTQTVSIRWFIVMIAFVGICCAVVGTVLGAMRSSGREHLTVSLLMIGVGIVLITVSGIAWRLTSQDAPSCRAMLGLGGSSLAGVAGSPLGAENAECGGALGGGVGGPGGVGSVEPTGRRFLSRIPPTYGRPHHPYAAMMYPEFQYRPPPPSYQASMQEYRLRLLLLDRDRQQQIQQQQQQQQQHNTPLSRACVAASTTTNNNSSGVNPPVSPPPTYRSQANTLVRPSLPIREAEVSRPPSYRSRSGAANNGGGNIIANAPIEPSVRSSVEVHHHHHRQVQHHHDEEAEVEVSAAQVLIQAVVDAKMKSAFDESSLCSSMTTAVTTPTERTKRLDKDNNTVTIVQTNSSSQVLAGCFAHPNQHQTTTTTTSSSSSSSPSSVLITVTTPTVHHSHQTSSSTTSSTSSSPSHTNSQNLQVLAQL